MRHRWVLLTAALLAVGCADDDATSAGSGPGDGQGAAVVVTPAVDPLPDAEIVARAGAAVWRVATEGCDWLGSGSAFAIDEHHLVTNRHVIANDTSPTLVSPSGEQRRGRVIGASDDVDVAVIEVDDALPVSLQWAPTDTLQPGEHVVVLGYPAPALTFTTSVGSIVNFQGRGGAREAMLTDAPIAPGNSGGPGLRADATVVGVVTQMTLDDPTQRAAIMFSAASVASEVQSFIADPDDVLSDCGQGPDYVPPIPDHFDVPSTPPPPPTTATTLPLPTPTVPAPTVTTPTTRPAPTTRPLPPTTTSTTEPPCPSGLPSILTEAVTVEPGVDEGTWNVGTTAHIVNESTESITLLDVDVAFLGPDGEPLGNVVAPAGDNLFRGGRASRSVNTTVESAEPPAAASAILTWQWREDRYAGCPVVPVSTP